MLLLFSLLLFCFLLFLSCFSSPSLSILHPIRISAKSSANYSHHKLLSATLSAPTANAMEDTDEDEQQVMEFDLPLPNTQNLFDLHSLLHDKLDLDPDDDLLNDIFHMVAATCDPFTQPEDTERVILSVDCLADVAMALGYQMLLREEDNPKEGVEIASLRFSLSLKFFRILEAIHCVLRADDELRVRYLHNDKLNWEATAKYWLPVLDTDDDEQELKLCYYMCCVLIMAVYKLFSTFSMALNPYADYLLRLWKTHTSIIALALEMDRELEEEAWATKGEYFDTPENIKRALLGSSAVRTVLAWILNQTPTPEKHDNDDHDIRHEVMLDFFDPLARTKRNCGSLVADERLLMVAQLVLRQHIQFSPVCQKLEDLSSFPRFDGSDYAYRAIKRSTAMGAAGDLVVDLYYDDQFDEDIKYVFGYFDSDEEESSEEAAEEHKPDDDIAMALRSETDLEFDDQGRDWRDCARGENVEFTQRFLQLEAAFSALPANVKDADDFFTDWKQMHQALELLALMRIELLEKIIHRVGQVIVNTTAKAVKDEFSAKKSDITPDKLYKHLVSPASSESLWETNQHKSSIIAFRKITAFELILINNPHLALAVIDELLMCKGFRRTLIWFLTHNVNLHMTLINYVYELVMGLRGNLPDGPPAPYQFSRKGAKLELSSIEQLMLLHELFINGSSWLLQGEYDTSAELPELIAKKLVSYFCLMILRLILNNVIVLDKTSKTDYFEDYSQDVQVLLFSWIGKVPEARDLFFRIKREMYLDSQEEPLEGCAVTEPEEIEQVLESLRRLPDHEIYPYTMTHAHARSVLTAFADRLFVHICTLYKIDTEDMDKSDVKSLTRDLHLFLTNYNVLARCKVFVSVIFNHLEDIVVGNRPSLVRKVFAEEAEESGPVDSEFNDEFLNGEGQFQETTQPTGTKKKTKKKKKKKGKKK